MCTLFHISVLRSDGILANDTCVFSSDEVFGNHNVLHGRRS